MDVISKVTELESNVVVLDSFWIDSVNVLSAVASVSVSVTADVMAEVLYE